MIRRPPRSTLFSLHDALPISKVGGSDEHGTTPLMLASGSGHDAVVALLLSHHADSRRRHRVHSRSEEHTSELQSRQYLVCRLLLVKKKISCYQSNMRVDAR